MVVVHKVGVDGVNGVQRKGEERRRLYLSVCCYYGMVLKGGMAYVLLHCFYSVDMQTARRAGEGTGLSGLLVCFSGSAPGYGFDHYILFNI